MCLQSCRGAATYLVASTTQTGNATVSPRGPGASPRPLWLAEFNPVKLGHLAVLAPPSLLETTPVKQFTPCCLQRRAMGAHLSDGSPS